MTNKFVVIAGSILIIGVTCLSACHNNDEESENKPVSTVEKPPLELNTVPDSQRVPNTDKVPDELRPPSI